MEKEQGVKKEVRTEKCVSCGEDTGIPVDLHIDLRHGYIEGAGQLCNICNKNLNT